MKIGYARVSTKEQNLDRQIKSLNEEGCEKIYMDKMSGKDFNREEYQRMISELTADDVVIIHSLDRLGRNYDDIMIEWTKITRTINANIKVLDMPLLDTSTSKDLTGKFIADIVLQILSYVAETERNNIKKRQAEGIAIAKTKGVYKGGTEKKIDKAIFDANYPSFKAGKITGEQFAKMLNCSRSKLYSYIKENNRYKNRLPKTQKILLNLKKLTS